MIDIPTWKWEEINMDCFKGLPCTSIQHYSIWVIVHRVTKSSCFLTVNTIELVEDYPKIYINEIVKLHGITLCII